MFFRNLRLLITVSIITAYIMCRGNILHPILCLGMMSHVGIKTYGVMDYQMTSSTLYTSASSYYPAWRARLDSSKTIVYEYPYWSGNTVVDSWIQIDLMVMFRITGVVFQGAPKKFLFLKKCQIAYSTGDPMLFIDYNKTNGERVSRRAHSVNAWIMILCYL